MTILGIKLTHDSAIALIHDGRLVFSYEIEKLNNFPRYTRFCIGMEDVEIILGEYGYSLGNIDRIVVDGWSAWDPFKMIQSDNEDTLSLELRRCSGNINITTNDLAGYGHVVKPTENILEPFKFDLPGQQFSYTSYQHVSGHVAGAYCTSGFAAHGEDSYVLVWDGGMPPQLFYYKFEENIFVSLGSLFPMIGYVYINFARAFRPFNTMELGFSIAGKAMAFMALGKVRPAILEKYRTIFHDLCAMAGNDFPDIDIVAILTNQFIKEAQQFGSSAGLADEDMLTTFQEFVQELLIEGLAKMTRRHPGHVTNLCLGGGCALNIKWNSSIRNSNLFRAVWVPPFPNDSGSAMGTACCEMMVSDRIRHLAWDVYSGPRIGQNGYDTEPALAQDKGYSPVSCPLKKLAKILHEYDEPVVFLHGSAELGPRALGNRSILAPASSATMKKRLNEMKNREDYRPVAPICLEEYAAEIFTPGSPDPYMLFEHFVREPWENRIPAIRHLDGTARLQTINQQENAAVHTLLTAYHELSGIPVLCNTSANFNGSGFFPDIDSAIKWGKANLIWNNNFLYVKNDFACFQVIMEKCGVQYAL